MLVHVICTGQLHNSTEQSQLLYTMNAPGQSKMRLLCRRNSSRPPRLEHRSPAWTATLQGERTCHTAAHHTTCVVPSTASNAAS